MAQLRKKEKQNVPLFAGDGRPNENVSIPDLIEKVRVLTRRAPSLSKLEQTARERAGQERAEQEAKKAVVEQEKMKFLLLCKLGTK